jgi:hypothetical protein
MDWYRSYHSKPYDPKWRIAAPRAGCTVRDVIAVFETMMVSASEAPDRGSLKAWRADVVAIALDWDEASVRRVFHALEGLVHSGGRITAWERRQPEREDTTAAARQARRRAKLAAAGAGVTSRQRERTEQRDSNHTGLGRESNLKIPSLEALDGLYELLAAAAGPAMADPAKFPALRNLSPIIGLMGPGQGLPCDLDRHILPAIRAKCAALPRGYVQSWGFFKSIVPQYRDACEAGAPAAEEKALARQPSRGARGADIREARRRAIADIVDAEQAAAEGMRRAG